MPRLDFIAESEKTPAARALIETAQQRGAPDWRVASIMARNPTAGLGWVEYWTRLLYEGTLPHKLKEMVRIRISVAHQCGYCSTVRSNVARAEGLSEALVAELGDYAASDKFSAREKAALRYADLFKAGEQAIDRDEVYAELKRHFSDAEIIELGMMCAQTDGVGRFVKSLNIVSWAEACEANPSLARAAS
ncbi:MAG TPA: carboxymuconolactone decarboxylase family protein [Burkholderiales bacterium]|nr:carboxymuconolactone decarboxylase family protein [Burkholderiales bacterium]